VDGNGDGSHWTDADNWSSGVPQNGDSVTIAPTMSTSAPHVTNMPGGLSLQDLTLTNSSLDGGAVTIKGDFIWSVAGHDTSFLKAELTVQGSATLSGAGLKDTNAPLTFKGDTQVSGGLVLVEDTGDAITNTGTFTLKGTGSFTGSGRFAWTGGAIEGNLDVAKTVSTAISGKGLKSLTSVTSKPVLLSLHGATKLTGPAQVNVGIANITNSGTFTESSGALLQGGTCCVSPARFLNSGKLVSATWANLGTMTLRSGTFIEALTCCVAPDHFANGGTLVVAASPKNTGITNLAFANTGQVKLVSGTFTVSGTGYHQAKSGVLAVTATGTKAGKNYGQLIVDGHAALAGKISVTTGGSFKPKAGQTLAVLSYRTRTRKFTATAGKVKFKVIYNAAGATIRFS